MEQKKNVQIPRSRVYDRSLRIKPKKETEQIIRRMDDIPAIKMTNGIG